MNYGQATIGTSPTPIVNLADRRDIVLLLSTGTIFIGDASVTVNTGCPIPANLPIYLSPGNPEYLAAQGTLYGIVASGTVTAGWLEMSNQEKS